MVDRVARVVAVSGISLLALVACSTDDSPSSAPATVAASIEQDSPEPAPTTPEPEPDPLPACAALFDGGAESIVQRVPNLLIELPESLDSTSAQPYMVMDSELRAVTDLAPSTMHDPIETMRAPFGEIAAALTSGGDALNSDTSGVDAAVSELVEQCTDAGFTIEDVDESPYGETVTSSRGNLLKEVGQLAAIVASSGDPLIEFAVKDIVVDYQCTSGYVEAPVNDHYIGLNFEITTTPELIDEPSPEFWMSAHDFSAWTTDGKRVNDPTGNAYSCLSDAESIPSSIGPNETVDGWIVLDLPADAAAVGYSWIGVSGGGGWEWSLED